MKAFIMTGTVVGRAGDPKPPLRRNYHDSIALALGRDFTAFNLAKYAKVVKLLLPHYTIVTRHCIDE